MEHGPPGAGRHGEGMTLPGVLSLEGNPGIVRGLMLFDQGLGKLIPDPEKFIELQGAEPRTRTFGQFSLKIEGDAVGRRRLDPERGEKSDGLEPLDAVNLPPLAAIAPGARAHPRGPQDMIDEGDPVAAAVLVIILGAVGSGPGKEGELRLAVERFPHRRTGGGRFRRVGRDGRRSGRGRHRRLLFAAGAQGEEEQGGEGEEVSQHGRSPVKDKSRTAVKE